VVPAGSHPSVSNVEILSTFQCFRWLVQLLTMLSRQFYKKYI